MEKTNKKSRMLSEIIKELQDWQNSEGDMEVVIANNEEACFDGFGKTFVILIAETNEKALGIIRSDVVLKP